MRYLQNRPEFHTVRMVFYLVVVVWFASMADLAMAETGLSNISVPKKISIEAGAKPDLVDIIPLAAKLNGRLGNLERKVSSFLDISILEKRLDEVEVNLKGHVEQLAKLKELEGYKYVRLVEIKYQIKKRHELYLKAVEPLNQEIRTIASWREEWLIEQNNWRQWQSLMVGEDGLNQFQQVFSKANVTVERALNILLAQLEVLLAVQSKASSLEMKIINLKSETNDLINISRSGALFETSPPMFSSAYFSQFSSKLLLSLQGGGRELLWTDSQYLSEYGWIILVHCFITLLIIVSIYRSRRILYKSEHWKLLATRPFSAGLFFVYMITIFILEYHGTSTILKFISTIVVTIAFGRIAGILVEVSWKRHFIDGIILAFIGVQITSLFLFPLPLFRLYILLTSIAGFIFCLRPIVQGLPLKESALYMWLLRLTALFCAVIMVSEFCGKHSVASYLFIATIETILSILVIYVLMGMIRDGIELLFRVSTIGRSATFHTHMDGIITQISFLIDIVIVGLILLPSILMIWGVSDSLGEAIEGSLGFGFVFGSHRITVGLLIVSISVLSGSFLVSGLLQKLLMNGVLVRRRMDKGVQHSMARLTHYIIMLFGFICAASALGIEVTKIIIMLSALGVGIGFGLQGAVNNFVCGLILLFERPVRVGDTIELGGQLAEIRRIGLRSTTIKTFDEADIIVPNSDLINSQVTNWTLTNRQVRITIPVGVAYGSDVSQVIEALMGCGLSHGKIVKYPSPQVLFLKFGESSLDFELRGWISDADDRFRVISDLHQEIDRRFREENIVISFPQRDIHVHQLDESDSF